MALQTKNFSKTGTGGGITYTYTVRVTENSVDTANNTSNVTVQCILKSNYSGACFSDYTTTVTAVINGSTKINSSKKRACSGTSEHVYATWTGNITHNADGTLPMTVSGKISQLQPDYFPSSGISVSGSMTATPITVKYAISYDANGGTGVPDSQEKIHGTDLTLSSTKPTRTGYTFLGWSTSSTATSATYAAGDTYTTDATATLYAVWQANKLSINYYSNGADYCVVDGVEVSIDTNVLVGTSVVYYDSTYTDAISGYTYDTGVVYMTKTDWEGTGFWNTEPDGSGYSIDENYAGTGQDVATALGVSLDNSDTSVDIYAQWKQNIVRLQYNANGGLNAPSGITDAVGTVITISTIQPMRVGYTFIGWGTSSDSTTAAYNSGDSYTLQDNAILYAIWEINKYSVNLGGTYIYYAYGIDKFYSDTNHTNELLSIEPPTQEGYLFKGIYKGTNQYGKRLVDQSGLLYSALSTFIPDKDTIYTHWIVVANEIRIVLTDNSLMANEFIEGESIQMQRGGIMYATEFIENGGVVTMSMNDGIVYMTTLKENV